MLTPMWTTAYVMITLLIIFIVFILIARHYKKQLIKLQESYDVKDDPSVPMNINVKGGSELNGIQKEKESGGSSDGRRAIEELRRETARYRTEIDRERRGDLSSDSSSTTAPGSSKLSNNSSSKISWARH